MNKPIAELNGISHSFGSVVACELVDLRIRSGSVLGLLGENGAGKSTLMRILAGFIRSNHGSINVGGQSLALGDVRRAAAAGVRMVHQHDSLIRNLTVWQNLVLAEPGRPNRRQTIYRAQQTAEKYGLNIDCDAVAGQLSPSQRQRVELVKSLQHDPKVLIMDEPTATLTPQESINLFDMLRSLVRQENRSVILISHKLDEIIRATDEVVVMRRGRIAMTALTAEVTANSLAHAMVGRDITSNSVRRRGDRDRQYVSDFVDKAPALRLTGLSAHSESTGEALHDCSLDVQHGEIVGIAGVEGNGQRALAEVLTGHCRPSAGTIQVDGSFVTLESSGSLRRAGLGVVPEDRHRSGCALTLSVADNLVLDELAGPTSSRRVRRTNLRKLASERAVEFDVVTPSLTAPMRTLSGGNQQKVVVARELSRRTVVLLAAHPTRGLDVGAASDVLDRLQQAAQGGRGILVISSDLDEVLALSDRVLVMFEGLVVASLRSEDVDSINIGLLMARGRV